MPVNATLKVSLEMNETGALANGGPFAGALLDFQSIFADGVGAQQIDRVCMVERTILTGANDDIDLSGTGIQTLLGANIAAVELVGLVVMNRRKDPTLAANTTNVTIGGSGSGVPGFVSAGLTLKPGGIFVAMSPDAAGLATITNSTGDILRLTNSAGATIIVTVALLLRSA